MTLQCQELDMKDIIKRLQEEKQSLTSQAQRNRDEWEASQKLLMSVTSKVKRLGEERDTFSAQSLRVKEELRRSVAKCRRLEAALKPQAENFRLNSDLVCKLEDAEEKIQSFELQWQQLQITNTGLKEKNHYLIQCCGRLEESAKPQASKIESLNNQVSLQSIQLLELEEVRGRVEAENRNLTVDLACNIRLLETVRTIVKRV